MRALTGERLQDQAAVVSPEMWGQALRRLRRTLLRAGRRLASARPRRRRRVGFVERRVGTASLVMLGALVSTGVVVGLLVSTLLMSALTNLGVDTHDRAQDDGSVGAVLAGWTP